MSSATARHIYTAICALVIFLVPFGRGLAQLLFECHAKYPQAFGYICVLTGFFFGYAGWCLLRITFRMNPISLVLWAGAMSVVTALMVLKPFREEYSHILFFGSLGYFGVAMCRDQGGRKAARASFVITGVMNLLDEGLQWIDPDRIFDLRDIALNLSGTILGMTLYVIFWSSEKESR